MKVLVLCGDNIFSYILGARLVSLGNVVGLGVSTRITGSLVALRKVYSKTSRRYFLYRSFVQFLSAVFTRYSLRSVARDVGVPVFDIASVARLAPELADGVDLCVAVNFDSIIPEEFIGRFRLGVINVHAGDLPCDRGISPVVWGFCRGDREITVTYYLMDGGIDTGIVLYKDRICIQSDWSLFRTYCEILDRAALKLIDVVSRHGIGGFDGVAFRVTEEGGTYNSWPSPELDVKMRLNSRRYFDCGDLRYLTRLLRTVRSES